MMIGSRSTDVLTYFRESSLLLIGTFVEAARSKTFSMSDLQRSFAKAKLAGLPYEPPIPSNGLSEDQDEEAEEEADHLRPLPESNLDDDSSSASSASSASSTGTIRPSPSKHLFARPRGFVPIPVFLPSLFVTPATSFVNTSPYHLLLQSFLRIDLTVQKCCACKEVPRSTSLERLLR